MEKLGGNMSDLREALEANYDKLAKEEVVEASVEAVEENIETPVEEEPAELETGGTSEALEAEEAEEAEEDIEPPYSWNKEAKQIFKKLPLEAKKVIAQRQEEADRGTRLKMEEAAKIRKKYEALDNLLEPHKQKWGLNGVDEITVLRRLLTTKELLDTNPIEGLSHIAKSYGLNLEQLGQVIQNSPKADPYVKELNSKVEQLEAMLKQRQEVEAQQFYTTMETEVSNFTNAVDNDGNLLYPYVNEVERDMQLILENTPAQPGVRPYDLLKEAYDRAVWANPSTRNKLLKSSQHSPVVQRQNVINKAKKASASISGAPSRLGNDADNEPTDLRAFLEAKLENYF